MSQGFRALGFKGLLSAIRTRLGELRGFRLEFWVSSRLRASGFKGVEVMDLGFRVEG